MATITENVARVLTLLKIAGVIQIDGTARPDRIFCWDTLGELGQHITDHPEHWSEDLWDPLHGRSVRHSFRERTRPSMQVCVHAISQLNHPTDAKGVPLPDHFLEIDFDESGPNSFEGVFIHGEEVLVNKVTGHLTNQEDIAQKLDRRLAETANA